MIAGILMVLVTIITITKHEQLRLLDDNIPHGDLREIKIKKQWHMWKGLWQLLTATLIGLYFGFPLAIVFICLLTVVHDAYINKYALDRPFDYLGTTSWMDVHLKKLFKTERRVFYVKLAVLAASILYLIISQGSSNGRATAL